MWHYSLTAKVLASDHRASYRHSCWDIAAPWRLEFQLYYYYYYYFYNSGQSPKCFKNSRNTKIAKMIHGKPSCRRTALNRCTQTESRLNKKKPSRSSPEHAVMRLPSSDTRGRGHWEDHDASRWLLGEKCTVTVDWNTWPLCAWLQFLLRRLTPVPMPRHMSRQSCHIPNYRLACLPWDGIRNYYYCYYYYY